MNVIFLDHFGVIIPYNKIEIDKYHVPSINDIKTATQSFDKNCVAVLNFILDVSNYDIVISSDWKKRYDINKLKNIYKESGIKKEPISLTPNINDKNIFTQREAEIKMWIDNYKPNKWIVIDDIFLNLDNFIWINNPSKGINNNVVINKIISIIN